MYKLLSSLILILLFGATLVSAGVFNPGGGSGPGTITVREVDGAPNVNPVTGLIVTNGSLTDNGDGTVTLATSGAATIEIDSSVVTGGTASSLLYVGAGPVLKQISITGLVLGNGASAPSAYAGVTCTNQVLRILSATGAGTCTTLTSAYVDTSIWTGTASTELLKASSQGVLTAYTGVTCTNQVLRILGADGAGTCVTLTSAYVDTSIWTGTATSGLLKASSQGVLTAATAGTDYAGPSTVNTWGDGIKQTFNPDATNAGINVGAHTAAPSTPVNGDIYYDSLLESFQCYEEGVWKNCISLLAEADTLDTVFDRGKIINGATSFANAFRVEDGSTDGIAIYTDATLGPQINGYAGGVENDVDYTRWLLTGKTFKFLANNRTTSIGTITSAASSGVWTDMTIDGEGSGNTITLTEERHFPVATCQNATASNNFDHEVTNFPFPTCDTGSNTQKAYLAFSDTTDESFEDSWILPTGFTGAIDASFRWKAVATAGAVGWCMQLVRVPDGATSDPAYPAQAAGNCVSDTAKGTTLQENVATISGVTCTSCAAGDHVYVKITRDANGSAVTDSMTGDAFLLTYGRTWRVAH